MKFKKTAIVLALSAVAGASFATVIPEYNTQAIINDAQLAVDNAQDALAVVRNIRVEGTTNNTAANSINTVTNIATADYTPLVYSDVLADINFGQSAVNNLQTAAAKIIPSFSTLFVGEVINAANNTVNTDTSTATATGSVSHDHTVRAEIDSLQHAVKNVQTADSLVKNDFSKFNLTFMSDLTNTAANSINAATQVADSSGHGATTDINANQFGEVNMQSANAVVSGLNGSSMMHIQQVEPVGVVLVEGNLTNAASSFLNTANLTATSDLNGLAEADAVQNALNNTQEGNATIYGVTVLGDTVNSSTNSVNAATVAVTGARRSDAFVKQFADANVQDSTAEILSTLEDHVTVVTDLHGNVDNTATNQINTATVVVEAEILGVSEVLSQVARNHNTMLNGETGPGQLAVATFDPNADVSSLSLDNTASNIINLADVTVTSGENARNVAGVLPGGYINPHTAVVVDTGDLGFGVVEFTPGQLATDNKQSATAFVGTALVTGETVNTASNLINRFDSDINGVATATTLVLQAGLDNFQHANANVIGGSVFGGDVTNVASNGLNIANQVAFGGTLAHVQTGQYATNIVQMSNATVVGGRFNANLANTAVNSINSAVNTATAGSVQQ